MQDDAFTIATMVREEIDVAVDWAGGEGWNPGLNDAVCYFAADPGGFLVGRLQGEPVAVISAVRYGEDFGFIGFYIVRPEFRGHGYGKRIWQAAMAHLDGRNVGLDGVVEQQDNYRKSGFSLAYRNIRFEGKGGGRAAEDLSVVPLGSVPYADLAAYDRPFFPTARPAFLQAWIDQPQGLALGILDEGRLAGYGVLRPCRTGYKIGPLQADTPELAERLFVALASRVEVGAPVFLDVPEVNPEAVALAARHGMQRVFETARMYTGAFPDLPMDRVFGVTSFEIG